MTATLTTITEAYIDSLAPNAGAIKNGRDLVKKNSFAELYRSADGTLLYGNCKGSGKEPYRCSADYQKPENPVFRCTCPSRQFPCKHNLALLYAFAAGKPFAEGDIPDDVAEKRGKAEQREAKKEADAAQADGPAPKRKTNKAALAKKLAAQLEGVELLEKLVGQTVQTGLASLDAKALKVMEEQAKQLGNYYVPGLQAAFRELVLLLRREGDRERAYTEAMDRLTTLHALIRKSREHLEARRENPELPMELASSLEERIGHAWQLGELREGGLVRTDAELLQLAFRSYADEARGEHVDEGWWIGLDTGELYATRLYRPFRAAKHMREDDSCYAVVQSKELYVYPGEGVPRARWEEATMRGTTAEDRTAVLAHARTSFADVLKDVKNQLKQPLAGKHPVALVRYARLGRTGDGRYALEDGEGRSLALGDIAELAHPVGPMLEQLRDEWRHGQAMLVMFEHNLDDHRLTAQPLSLMTPHETVRFIY
ncbi:SWIM zinc finger family protein [Paenibacillus hodogayensis]|uniref:SWIM zinc finger family protein n=1 Tax=Paenibacillus hodogayensis TaxID=279208 RepID=A0ABV5VZZ0_9BACL